MVAIAPRGLMFSGCPSLCLSVRPNCECDISWTDWRISTKLLARHLWSLDHLIVCKVNGSKVRVTQLCARYLMNRWTKCHLQSDDELITFSRSGSHNDDPKILVNAISSESMHGFRPKFACTYLCLGSPSDHCRQLSGLLPKKCLATTLRSLKDSPSLTHWHLLCGDNPPTWLRIYSLT